MAVFALQQNQVFNLADVERDQFPLYTVDIAPRVAQKIADLICSRFAVQDRDLLEKQIEADFLLWAIDAGVYTYKKGLNGRPVRGQK